MLNPLRAGKKAASTSFSFGLKIEDGEFQKLRGLIFKEAGISLGDHKKELVRTRLQKRLRELGLASYSDYYQFVTEHEAGHQELIHLIDALSTNKTDFFRENQHFEFLTQKALPPILDAKIAKRDKRLRIWSAGCSTGEEPYTLAMVLTRAIPNLSGWNLKILATDISTQVLARASAGIYSDDQIVGVPPMLRSEFFSVAKLGAEKQYTVSPALKSLISFRRLNLMDDTFPFSGLFDVIFCRNVMIYFDKPTQEALVNKYHRHLQPGGFLLIGHSESLTGVKSPFHYVMPTIYKK